MFRADPLECPAIEPVVSLRIPLKLDVWSYRGHDRSELFAVERLVRSSPRHQVLDPSERRIQIPCEEQLFRGDTKWELAIEAHEIREGNGMFDMDPP